MHSAPKYKYRLSDFKGSIFVLPALVFYLLFVIVPAIRTVFYSLHEWNGVDPVMKFTGLQNYTALAKDEILWKALGHNLIWIAVTITLPVCIGLVLAALLASREIKFKLLFRTAYYMPCILSLTIVAYIWEWIFSPNIGVLNSILKGIGLENLARPWLGDEKLVLPSLLTVGSWTHIGFCMVVFLAAIQSISYDFYEVALIEGANSLQRFWHITVPMVKNSITLMVVNSLIGSFKVFNLIFIMTGGGPYNSSEVIATYMYRTSFTLYKVGYGSAIAMVLAVTIAVFSIVFMKYSEGSE